MSRRRRNKSLPQPARRIPDPAAPPTLLELDTFSVADVRRWKRASEQFDELQRQLYFGLESQRVAHRHELLEALQGAAAEPFDFDGWVRMVDYQYALQPLSAAGSSRHYGGRFNIGREVGEGAFGSFAALYIAEDLETAYREYYQIEAATVSGGLAREDLAAKMRAMAADRKHQLIFYLALPLAIGLVMGGSRAGMARLLPQELSLLYWVGSMLLVWGSFDIGSRVTALALKPWKPPLLVILLLGAVLARIATEPVSRFWVEGFIGRIDPEALKGLAQAGAASVQPWVQRTLRPYYLVAIWLAVNYYYLIVLRLPRYGVAPREPVPALAVEPLAGSFGLNSAEVVTARMSAPPVMPAPEASPLDHLPAFVSQLCPQVGLSLIALEAEDHYVRVHGELKSALISYRFADALRDVAALDGLQVHRSFWVNRAAIRKIRRAGRSVSLEMANGLSIPVSHAYKELARRAVGVPGTAPASAHSRIHLMQRRI